MPLFLTASRTSPCRTSSPAVTLALASILHMMLASAVSAQETTTTFQEQYKLIKAPNAVVSLGGNLFGDKHNLYTGGLEFTQTDVSLPGNSALPVAIGRRLVAGQYQFDKKAFGRWDLDIPHLHGMFANGISSSPQGWVDSGGTASRCTNFGAPAETRGLNGKSIWAPDEFWHGSFLYFPGQGDQQLLRRVPENPSAPAEFTIDGVEVTSFPVVTSSKWAIGCLPALANGTDSGRTVGEGFVAVSPDGTKYKFDWLVVFPARTLTKSNNLPRGMKALRAPGLESGQAGGSARGLPMPNLVLNASLPMNEIWILPTQVVDRFGNTVKYEYDPARPANLKSISSNDGRVLNITYVKDTSLIETVSDGTRTWKYAYKTDVFADLSTVTLPDGSSWQFDDLKPLIAELQYNAEPQYCNERISPFKTVLTGSMTHPSGATGTFTLTPTEHGRSDVQEICLDKQILIPIYYYTNSLTEKSITGPGLPGMKWTYQYGPGNGSFSPCNGCVTSTFVDVTDPGGNVTRHTYGNRYFVSEGKLEQIDAGWSGSSALRTTKIEYAPVGTEPYPEQDGTSDQLLGDAGTDLKNRPEQERTIIQQGVTFRWKADTFDIRARPATVTRSSSLGFTRTETTSYKDDPTLWVLGQVEKVVANTGEVLAHNTYDEATATLLSVSTFGKLQRSLLYHDDGTVLSLTDGGGNVTKFANYKRGIAQNIGYPDGSSESAVVNDIGKITSVTNGAGYTTGFGYDVMGRLESITHPEADTVAWKPASISFSQSQTGKFDLPAGHWRQQITVGDAYTVMYYDALWRPVYTEKWDSTDAEGTMRIVKQNYDFAGRQSFESYPKRSHGEIGDGRTSEFDVLGRPTRILVSSELGTLSTSYAYNSGFETAITDPRQNTTTYRYQAFDEPIETAIANIAAPEGVNLAIERDVFGKPLSITRSGGGKSLARRYVYDSFQQLCKTLEPETGATVQDYDAANNVKWRATGLALPLLTCDTTTAFDATARKTTFEYDARNRLLSTTFGDGSAAVTRTYTPDGLPETITSNGTRWTYTYNKRRLNERESLEYGGATYNIDRAYDTYGSLAQLTYPVDKLTVSFNPNALGEARQVGSYATDIRYHPNGAVAEFVYGNGIRRSLSQNTRGLPLQATDADVLDEVYAYDQNGNVDTITDRLEGVATRAMRYDGLDRLSSVSAPGLWGDVNYGYDALDNLTTATMTAGANARSTLHKIDPVTNRLDSIANGAARFNFSYGYDEQGNVTRRGTQTYRFDLANRMTQADGRASYVYDGLGRRTSIVGTDDVNRVQVYSQGGQLLYVAPSAGAGTKYIYLNNHQIAEVK